MTTAPRDDSSPTDTAPDSTNHDDAPRPHTPSGHLVWRIVALVAGSTAAIAVLGEVAKLLVGAET